MKMGPIDKASYLLMVIGGLNWGLVGFFKYNLVDKVFSGSLARVIYAVVGVGALYGFYSMVTMMANMKKDA